MQISLFRNAAAYLRSHSSHSSPWSRSCCSHSTFELSSFPAFPKFYWEIALTTCRGHGKYFAGTTLCLLTSPRWSFFMWKSLTGAWIWSFEYYWLVMCSGQSKSQFWKKWWEYMTRWNFPSALELEMMSAACVPLAGVIKNGGVSFHSFFFFFYFSSLLWHSRRVCQIEIRGETKNLNKWQFPVLFSTLANVPILAAIFPILKLACSGIMHALVIKGGESFFWCDLHSYVTRII